MKALTPLRDVYFVQGEALGLIKIGLANEVEERMRSLRVNSPDRLNLLGIIRSSDAEAIEAGLHTRFRALRVHGEWHRPEPELLEFIAANAVSLEASRDAELDAALERAYGAGLSATA